MRVYEGIAELFAAEGVEEAYTLMADGIMELVSEVQANEQIDVVQSRHEQAAVAMADGHSKASEDVGVCLVGRGGALAQTGAALGNAGKRGANMLLLTADVSQTVPRNPSDTKPEERKQFDQYGYLSNLLGEDHVVDIRSKDVVLSDLEDVFRRLRVGEGPIAVQIPRNLFTEEVDRPDSLGGKGTEAVESTPHITPREETIGDVVDHYLESDATKPPVIIGGRGVTTDEAEHALEELAERTSGLLATSLQGRGLFEDHPYSIGMVGSWGNPTANEHLSESGCILAFGCSLNPFTLDSGHLIRDDATVIHVDTDPSSIERYTPVDVGVVGDVHDTATLLLDALEAAGIDRTGAFWTESLRQELANVPRFEDRAYPQEEGTIDPRTFITHLNEVLPEERFIVSDGGHCMRWVIDGIDIESPQDYTWTIDFGAIGQGLCQGIGASRALTDRACVTFCGDAGFMMHLAEVETAARNEAPVIIVVFNDAALGEEYHKLDDVGIDPDGSLISTPDLGEVASSLGATGYRIASEADLQAISSELEGKPEGPIVLDCRVNVEFRHRTAGE